MEDEFHDLEIEDNQDTDDFNILLLGETGIGKSTFINSIANYLHHPDLDTAMQEELFSLIPCMFNITDDESNKSHKIVVGSDANECQSVGDSATQDVRSYVFPFGTGKTRLRLIDTPGMGDPRGVEQDDKNCDQILSKIGHLNYLHAICLLFRPNDARITITFEYCVKQILSRLEKSAARNIIFVFTNSKATNYKPGETIACLKKMVEDIKVKPPHVDIKVEDNVFCFDNEAFRFLAATKKGLKFNNETKEVNSRSWQKASAELSKLIRYIVGDVRHVALVPHLVKSSISINEARRVIKQLSQPLADISQLILDNLHILDRRQKELEEGNQSMDKLKEKLHVPVINLKVIKMIHPATVCCGPECAEVLRIAGRTIWNYKQRCHDPCHLKNVPEDIIGAPHLEHCAAMDRTTKTCIKCQCARDVHMHVYYMTKAFHDEKIDKNIQNEITTKEKALEEARRLIKKILKRKSELEHEKDVIILCAAKFAEFLQKSAITPFNDAYRKYIDYMMFRELSLGKNADHQAIQHFKGLLTKYDQIKQAFDGVRKLPGYDDDFKEMKAEDLQSELQKLYSLKHNGNKIKELYSTQNSSREKEYKQSEYVHSSLRRKFQKEHDKRETQSEDEEQTKSDTQGMNIHRGRSMSELSNIINTDNKEISKNWRIRDNPNESNSITPRRYNSKEMHHGNSRGNIRSFDRNRHTQNISDHRDFSNNHYSAPYRNREHTLSQYNQPRYIYCHVDIPNISTLSQYNQPRYIYCHVDIPNISTVVNLHASNNDSSPANTRQMIENWPGRSAAPKNGPSKYYRPPPLRDNRHLGDFH